MVHIGWIRSHITVQILKLSESILMEGNLYEYYE